MVIQVILDLPSLLYFQGFQACPVVRSIRVIRTNLVVLQLPYPQVVPVLPGYQVLQMDPTVQEYKLVRQSWHILWRKVHLTHLRFNWTAVLTTGDSNSSVKTRNLSRGHYIKYNRKHAVSISSNGTLLEISFSCIGRTTVY